MPYARARVFAFPKRPDVSHLLTVRDRLHLHEAGEDIAASGFRCVIGRDRNGICHDFIQLHRASKLCVAWTLVRSGQVVRVWRGSHGADLGTFPTVREAVAAVLAAAGAAAACTQAGKAAPPGH